MAARLMPRGALLWAVPVALGLVGFGALEFSPLRIGPAEARAADAAAPKWSVAQKVEFKDPNSGYWYVGTIFRVNGDEHEILFDRAPSQRTIVTSQMIRPWTPGNVGPNPVLDPKTGKPDNSAPKAAPAPAAPPPTPALSEPKPAAPAEPAPATKPAAPKPKWRVGQRVDFKEQDMGFWNVGTIQRIRGTEYEISFDGWKIRPAATVPARLIRPWTRGNEGPGPVKDPKTGLVDMSEPPKEIDPPQSPDQPGAGVSSLKAGQKVEALRGSTLSTATVTATHGNEVKVKFDDGTEASLPATSIMIQGTGMQFGERTEPNRPLPGSDTPEPFVGAAVNDERALTPSSIEGSAQIDLAGEDVDWDYTPDPGAKAMLPPQAIPQRYKPFTPYSFTCGGFFLTEGKAWIVHNPATQDSQILELSDLSAGSIKTWQLPPKLEAKGISPDGKRLVLVSTGQLGGSRNRVEIWSLEDNKPKYVLGFIPESKVEEGKQAIYWAAFVAPDRLLTLSGANGRTLRLWDLPSCKAKWSATVDSGTATMSPGGKQVALLTSKRLLILDVATGKPLARSPNTGGTLNTAFREDGAAFAAFSANRLVVWNLRTGNISKDVIVDLPETSSVTWASNDFLLFDSNLVSVKTGGVCWKYAPQGGNLIGSGRGLIWYLWHKGAPPNAVPHLSAVQLPHEAAMTAAETNGGDGFLFEPGSKVSLIFNISDPTLAAEAKQIIEKALNDRKLQIAPDAPVKILVRLGGSFPTQYRFLNRETLEIVKKTLILPQYQVIIAGQFTEPLWFWEYQAEALSGHPNSGPALDQWIAKAQKPSAECFKFVPFPERLPKRRPVDRRLESSSLPFQNGIR